MNYYTKLITLKVDSQYILLYGFSGQTNQQCYDWKTINIDKKIPVTCFQTIWDEKEQLGFEAKIQEKTSVQINARVLIYFGLIQRPKTLSNHIDDIFYLKGPVIDFCFVSEFWSIDKKVLINKVKQALAGQGKILYQKMINLFSILKQECGIDFLDNGWKLGNFEVYSRLKYQNNLLPKILKEDNYRTAVIEKCIPIEDPLIILCASKQLSRWHIDMIKTLNIYETSVSFHAKEQMSHMRIQAWSAETGELVYAYDKTFVMNIELSFNVSNGRYNISDPWTEQLSNSASNQKDKIQQIKNIDYLLRTNQIKIDSIDNKKINFAFDEGNAVCSSLKIAQPKGAFVPKNGKVGEIGSFLKIQGYLSDENIKKAILADPFFDVKSICKLLARIPAVNMKLEIITSLNSSDPNTGGKVDAVEASRKFLQKNSTKLHQNLIVKNLRRGNKQVFHDRCLIRYFNNGSIDGFLLSNSLNSAGQNYPFIIAPLEKEVCLEFCDYLNKLTSSEEQNKLCKKDSINCEILYDSSQKNTIKDINEEHHQSYLFELLKEYLHAGYEFSTKLGSVLQSESNIAEFRFTKIDLSQVISAIKSDFPQNPTRSVKAIGEMLNHEYCWSATDILNELDKNGEKLVEPIINIARNIEENEDHELYPINSSRYKNWAVLKGTACIYKQGIHTMLDDPENVFYTENYYLYGCYQILLQLSPEDFIKLMKETSSPLMLNILTTYMAVGDWMPELYNTLLTSKISWILALAADWIFSFYQRKSKENEWICSILSEIALEKRLLQYLYVLSQLAFEIRCSKNGNGRTKHYKDLFELVIKNTANTLDECATKKIISYDNFDWLFDCEDTSCCNLHLDLAKNVSILECKHWILDRAITYAKDRLYNQFTLNSNKQLVKCLAYAIYLRYDTDGDEFICKDLFNERIFEKESEPYRKDYDYDYDNWHKARVQAEQTLELLQQYLYLNPDAKKVSALLDTWLPLLNLDPYPK